MIMFQLTIKEDLHFQQQGVGRHGFYYLKKHGQN